MIRISGKEFGGNKQAVLHVPTQVTQLPVSVQKLVALLKAGKEAEDGIEKIIVERLSKFDHENHREAIVEAGKNAKRKNTKAAYDVGKKHCIQYTIDGDMDEGLRYWANENQDYYTFAQGVLNQPQRKIKEQRPIAETVTRTPQLRPEQASVKPKITIREFKKSLALGEEVDVNLQDSIPTVDLQKEELDTIIFLAMNEVNKNSRTAYLFGKHSLVQLKKKHSDAGVKSWANENKDHAFAQGILNLDFATRVEKANVTEEDDETSEVKNIQKKAPETSRHDLTYELIKEKLQAPEKCELSPGEIKHIRDFEIKDEDERELLSGLAKNASEDNEVAYILGKKESMRRNRNTNVSDASLYRWVLENKNHAFAKGLTNRNLTQKEKTDSEINRRIKDAKPTAYAKLRIWESEIHNAQSEKIEDFVLRMQLHFYSKLPEYKDSQVMYVLGQNLSIVTNKNADDCTNHILDNPDDFFALGLRRNANVLKYASDEKLKELKEKDTNDEFKSLIETELKNRQAAIEPKPDGITRSVQARVIDENALLAALNQVEITSSATTGFANIEVIVENKAVSEETFAAQKTLSSVVIKKATPKKDQGTVQTKAERPRLIPDKANAVQKKGNPIIPDADGINAKIVIEFLTSGKTFPPGFDKKDIPDFGFREQDIVSLIDAAVKGKKGLYSMASFWLGVNKSVREYMNRYISAYQKWLEANKIAHSFAKGYYRP